MKFYKQLAKEFLAKFTGNLRRSKNWTQEKMAEQLRITCRAYSDLERGKYCFSAITLLFLLIMLKDEEVKSFLDDFRKRVKDLEHRDVA